MSNTLQADGSIHEDQVLNFIVNTIDEEVEIDFAPNAQTTAEDLFEVLVGACADGTSVSTLCEKSEDSPHHNTVLYHLREKFDLESVERTGNTLLQKDVLDVLPEQVEVCADLHLRPTMVTRTRRTASIIRKRNVEPLHSTPTPHSTRV